LEVLYQSAMGRFSATQPIFRSCSKGILAISTEAIFTVGPDFRICAFSAGAETMFGYASSELLGQPLDMLLPQRYRADHHRHMAGFAAQGQRSKLMRERSAIYGVRRSVEGVPDRGLDLAI